MKKVSCIIPVYNEGPRIGEVLNIVTKSTFLHEIIVVDDGSKDNTVEVVKTYPAVKLIIHEKNKGKSAAINTGFKSADGEYIFFLDADLEGLRVENLNDLIQPIINNEADISISLRKNAPGFWKMIGLDYISGERVFKKEVLENIIDDVINLPRFGLEVFINRQIIKKNYKIAVVKWDNVSSPYKYKKIGMIKGVYADFLMIMDIFRTIGFFGPVIQIIRMKRLIV